MAPEPPVVAELGRPETPDETAARKAEFSRAYRASQNTRNLVAALLVTLAIVAVVVFAVPRGVPAPRDAVDVEASAAAVEAEYGRTVIVPDVPASWRPNSARVEAGAWRVVYAPATGFVRVAQAFDATDSWPSRTLGGYAPTGSVTIDGIEWDEYRLPAGADAANISYAIATPAGDDIVMIYGATDADTAALAADGVTDQIRALREETR